MISYEERREVAARLREMARQYGDGWGVVRCGDLPAPVDDAMFMCNIGRVICASELFNRLADLIEPESDRTCRMRYDPVHQDFVCSACGEWHSTATYDACDADDCLVFRPYKYCPNCGAKVVE